MNYDCQLETTGGNALIELLQRILIQEQEALARARSLIATNVQVFFELLFFWLFFGFGLSSRLGLNVSEQLDVATEAASSKWCSASVPVSAALWVAAPLAAPQLGA
jgi:hypothetical protein